MGWAEYRAKQVSVSETEKVNMHLARENTS